MADNLAIKVVENKFAIELSFNYRAVSFILPINPETIDIKESGKGKTYDIVGKGGGTSETRAGEINVIQNPALTEISFSSNFPASYYPAVIVKEGALQLPSYYLGRIKEWLRSNQPIRIHIVSSSFVIDIPASIEKFDWKEVAGSPGDIEYNISLKEYVYYSAIKAKVVTAASKQVLIKKPKVRPDERSRPDTYTLKAGDTLIKIAMNFFNADSSRYKDIQKLNGITDAQLKSLQIGRVIKLPKN
ncbi:LysM peptidoglycan-binding domain-containing protein [Paenibacillus psychroresistens]|uniref:LysM peptidoglycan-binding domain-containing protein n=1 Tax=Paenibacillus psychroresistens TaxID=1778678 RepID=A0A6B8REI0_9BACL|nr:LysM peptidoglycan-binding domain-containing protein [Paenibacillus psychroresistens]QGQ93955.1 LysM peptidoglycan-binding domain-containing protein [Paenibacillus psychroresistens]